MGTKKQLTDSLKERLVDVAERGKVIGQALKVRADMAATRRSLRATYAELGERCTGASRAVSWMARPLWSPYSSKSTVTRQTYEKRKKNCAGSFAWASARMDHRDHDPISDRSHRGPDFGNPAVRFAARAQ